MERLIYFKGEFYLIIIGGAVFLGGLGTEPGAALFGLALMVGTGFFAWRKWQLMDAEATERGVRARAAVAPRTTPANAKPPVSGSTQPKETDRYSALSTTARRVAEALSALGEQPSDVICGDLGLDQETVLAALRDLDDAEILKRRPGGTYALVGIRSPSPAGVGGSGDERSDGSAKAAEPSAQTDEATATSSAECTTCGAPLVGDEDFCPDCGERVVDNAGTPDDRDGSAVDHEAPDVEDEPGGAAESSPEPPESPSQTTEEAAIEPSEHNETRHTPTCSSCRAELPSGMRFCRECGTPAPPLPPSAPTDAHNDEHGMPGSGDTGTQEDVEGRDGNDSEGDQQTDCVSCGSVLLPGAKFCRSCGNPVVAISPHEPDPPSKGRQSCVACGSVVPDEARFCRGCGAPV